MMSCDSSEMDLRSSRYRLLRRLRATIATIAVKANRYPVRAIVAVAERISFGSRCPKRVAFENAVVNVRSANSITSLRVTSQTRASARNNNGGGPLVVLARHGVPDAHCS